MCYGGCLDRSAVVPRSPSTLDPLDNPGFLSNSQRVHKSAGMSDLCLPGPSPPVLLSLSTPFCPHCSGSIVGFHGTRPVEDCASVVPPFLYHPPTDGVVSRTDKPSRRITGDMQDPNRGRETCPPFAAGLDQSCLHRYIECLSTCTSISPRSSGPSTTISSVSASHTTTRQPRQQRRLIIGEY